MNRANITASLGLAGQLLVTPVYAKDLAPNTYSVNQGPNASVVHFGPLSHADVTIDQSGSGTNVTVRASRPSEVKGRRSLSQRRRDLESLTPRP